MHLTFKMGIDIISNFDYILKTIQTKQKHLYFMRVIDVCFFSFVFFFLFIVTEERLWLIGMDFYLRAHNSLSTKSSADVLVEPISFVPVHEYLPESSTNKQRMVLIQYSICYLKIHFIIELFTTTYLCKLLE